MAVHVCDHLRPLEDLLVSQGSTITFAGQAWSSNCRHWIYFDTVLDCEGLRARLGLPACVTVHENNDPRSGCERGFVCTQDHDAIMGRLG
jgi:hypothetical protein